MHGYHPVDTAPISRGSAVQTSDMLESFSWPCNIIESLENCECIIAIMQWSKQSNIETLQ